jgi:8-oxo-dGTP pyrophosphatase MutT (NUDIX family)
MTEGPGDNDYAMHGTVRDESTIPGRMSDTRDVDQVVTPRPAACVLLVDVDERPWRLLMMRRPRNAGYAPGTYTFPGGKAHEEDGRVLADISRAAAIRELFEEVGILLALDRNGRPARDIECEQLRALLATGTSWSAALREFGLTLAGNELALLSHWIRSEPPSRRFDTRFYVARRPAGQTVHPQPGAVTDHRWIAPAEALAPGGLDLGHAARCILESVACEPEVAHLIAKLHRRRREPVPVVSRD